MLTYDEAVKDILSFEFIKEGEAIDVQDSVGRILNVDIRATLDIPPARTSNLDGFAFVRASGDQLKLAGRIVAGQATQMSYDPGQAVAIMTGAVVPAEFDTVVAIEDCEQINASLWQIKKMPELGHAIRPRGGDSHIGQVILPAGTRILPQHLAIISAQGLNSIEVRQKARVVFVSTGAELVETGHPLPEGKVYNSSLMMLKALASGCDADILYVDHIAVDDAEQFKSVIAAQLALKPDLIVTTGAVSMGTEDYVPAVFTSLGIDKVFHKVAIKPGKPIWFGKKDQSFVFGLPGNPVSTLLGWLLFIRPLLGLPAKKLWLPLSEDIQSSMALSRFLKAKLSGKTVTPLCSQDSYQVSSLLDTDCFIRLPAHSTANAGDLVEVFLL